MKRLHYIFITVLVVTLSACNDWLDVSPRTEIKSEDNFANEQGFKDALTGVYLTMTGESLYGKELTYGMVDVLAQYYTGITSTSHGYYYDAQYDYEYSSVESRINAIWSNGYNVIANLNELIAHLEEANVTLFTGRNYHLIRGEAYGLRALMHFDLLRLFGPSYKADATKKCIPYVVESGTFVTPLSTVDEVLTLALGDLAIAEQELAIDPVQTSVTTSTTDDATYERDRTYKFNYYAVKMLQARIYMYMGDYTRAALAVEPLITQTVFTWVPETEISTTDSYTKNYVFSEELIFALYVSNMRDLYTASFTSNSGFYMTEESYEALYEMNTLGAFSDYRYIYQTEALTEIRVSSKLKQPENGNALYHFRMPMMRLSEAYYIAAECALRTGDDVTTAATYLNTVRQHRGLTIDLLPTLTVAEMENEIYKEYAKEFCCEGQLFFYFKRLNIPQIPVISSSGYEEVTTYVSPQYVLPLPDDEIEYGDRNAEINK